ncbi:MAG: hypothetical protein A3J28_03715 [Acidobacteria bacterium RIFCSPLOWO2_12_FULL_60_22]|nr:MAG: hypothetical protein A3J28_03715 [Acidobacteria bacterium RIFCSPLOWO2_12_FULL_60_22]
MLTLRLRSGQARAARIKAVILSPSLVILSEAKNLLLRALRVNSAKNLLFIPDGENKSRFFSPANTAGLQNDTFRGFSTNW